MLAEQDLGDAAGMNFGKSGKNFSTDVTLNEAQTEHIANLLQKRKQWEREVKCTVFLRDKLSLYVDKRINLIT